MALFALSPLQPKLTTFPKPETPVTEHASAGFSYSLVRSDGRTLLESTCKKCGESNIVSRLDGSLEEWEKKHSRHHNPVGTPMPPGCSLQRLT